MQRISSNLTIVFKLFIPTFWITFYGLLTMFILFMDPKTSPLFSSIEAKIMVGVVFILFAALIYFTLFQLLRFDASSDHFLISNYLKTYKYKFKDVASISTTKFLFINLLKIKMRQKTTLGNSFNVLYKKQYWDEFLRLHPEIEKLKK